MLKSSVREKIILTFLISLLFIFSYLREFTFEAINSYVKGDVSPLETYLSQYSIKFWTQFKWVLICLTFMLFTFLTTFLINTLFNYKPYTKLTFLTFIAFFITAAIFIFWGIIIDDFLFGYTIARAIMDFTQTPILFLMLFAVFKVFPKQ